MKNSILAASLFLFLMGVLCFIPALNPGHLLFGYIATTTLQSILYLVIGFVGLYAVYIGSSPLIRLFGQIVGICLFLDALAGFLWALPAWLGSNSMANIMHLVLAVVFAYAGFIRNSPTAPSDSSSQPNPVQF